MKTLSLWQPWADLIFMGYKHNETRSWSTNYRGKLAIHATNYKKLPQEVYTQIAKAIGIEYQGSWLYYLKNAIGTFGVILGTVDLIDVVPTEKEIQKISPIEIACGDYSQGRFAWKFDNIERFDKPITVVGHQGLWNCEEDEK